MDTALLTQMSEFEWWMEPRGAMRVPGLLFASEELIREMDDAVLDQLSKVASLPGLVKAALAMPDAHWGYGFPIGGVGAFDAEQGGVVSAGGVGFDISCGVRTLLTGMKRSEMEPQAEALADALFHHIPAGVGSRGRLKLDAKEMESMLAGGAVWAVAQGYGTPADLERIESGGRMEGADPSAVSPQAKQRQEEEMGTLGSGNHYLEVQEITEVYDEPAARAFGLRKGEMVVSLHCGSRGLGHQVATDYAKRMLAAAAQAGIRLPDRELACAPILSPAGNAYLGAMRSAINCALANRQILAQRVRDIFAQLFPGSRLDLLYDVSHNTCRLETHEVEGRKRVLQVHRKGATCAWPPGHPELPEDLRSTGQPVLVGGTMGTASYVLKGLAGNGGKSFASACHGAGRQMSRTQAARQWNGRTILEELHRRGILVRCASLRGLAEEAPDAYKEVSAVVEATESAGLAAKVARLAPFICLKG